MGDLQTQLLQRHEELQHARNEVVNFQHRVGEMEAVINTERDVHMKQVNELQSVIQLSSQQLADKDAAHHQRCSQYDADIAALHEERDNLQVDNLSMQEKMKSMEGDLVSRMEQLEQYMAEEELSQTRREQISHELQNCYQQIDETNRQMDSVRVELGHKCDELALQIGCTHVEAEKVAALENAIREVEVTLEGEKTALELEIARLQEKLNSELVQKAQLAVQDAKQTEQLKELKELRVNYSNEQLCVRELETNLANLKTEYEGKEKAAADTIAVLKIAMADAVATHETDLEEAKNAFDAEVQRAKSVEEALEQKLEAMEKQLSALEREKAQQQHDMNNAITDLRVCLTQTEENIGELQSQKLGLEHLLMDKEVNLEGALANVAQLDHLLQERAEAASSAARNAEFIVAECDNLRQHHANAFSVLNDRHEKIVAAGKDSNFSSDVDLATAVYEVTGSETRLQKKLEEVAAKYAEAEEDLRQELAARVAQFEKDIDDVRIIAEEAKMQADDLKIQLHESHIHLAEYDNWLQQMVGQVGPAEGRDQVRYRFEQHQQLLIDMGEELRSFLFQFPTQGGHVDGVVPGLKIPSATDFWASDEFLSLREGLMVSVRCVLNMYHATEEKWQKKYDELDQVVETKTADLLRLETAIETLRKTQTPHLTHMTVENALSRNPSVSPRVHYAPIQSELRQQDDTDRLLQKKKDLEQEKDLLRQSSIEASITTLTDQISSLKTELGKERKVEASYPNIAENTHDVHQSREKVTRLAENNRVLILEVEEKRLAQEKTAKALFEKDQQNEILQSELRRLRGSGTAKGPGMSRGGGMADPSVGHRMFDIIDSNGDGSIDRREFANALQEGGRVLNSMGMQFGSSTPGQNPADTFRATGQNLQRLRQECAEYREELARLK